VLETIVANADAKRAVAILRLEVSLPQIGWLEDVAIAVDDEFVVGHERAPPRGDDNVPAKGTPRSL
jgi:hypothetical protein